MNRIKSLVPLAWKQRIKRIVESPAPYESELGEFILQKAAEFSRERGGDANAIGARSLRESITKGRCLEHMNKAHQQLQTAFSRDYESNLYEFYREQQYLILMTFLSYPFSPGSLKMAVAPFHQAVANLRTIRVLDYGSGLPYGLFDIMRGCPIESITTVDLDLIHAEFSEFVLRGFKSSAKIVCHRFKDTNQTPVFHPNSFNLIYAKDILEHVKNPEQILRLMLDAAEPECVAYVDIRNHGERTLQHISPNLKHLELVMREYGFKQTGTVEGLPEFRRKQKGPPI